MNKKAIFISLILLSTLFSLGSGDTSDDSSEEVSKITESSASQGMTELGPVKDASISIHALDGYSLYTTTTGNDGFFKIDTKEFKQIIEDRYGLNNLKFVKVISTGGIDTDPNDDGIIIESENKEVHIPVQGVVPVETLLNAESFRINFITTALVKILEEQGEVSDEKINYIAKKLGVGDINEDGEINIKDLISYNMKEHDSVAETELREGYLESFHTGETEKQKLFIENLKYSVGFSAPKIINESGIYKVNLSKMNTNNTMYYGISENYQEPNYEEYYGQELILNPKSVLFFEECSPIEGCYKLRKLIFYSDKYYEDYDREYIDQAYLNEVEEVLASLKEARKKLAESGSKVSKLESDIADLDSQIKTLEGRLIL